MLARSLARRPSSCWRRRKRASALTCSGKAGLLAQHEPNWPPDVNHFRSRSRSCSLLGSRELGAGNWEVSVSPSELAAFRLQGRKRYGRGAFALLSPVQFSPASALLCAQASPDFRLPASKGSRNKLLKLSLSGSICLLSRPLGGPVEWPLVCNANELTFSRPRRRVYLNLHPPPPAGAPPPASPWASPPPIWLARALFGQQTNRPPAARNEPRSCQPTNRESASERAARAWQRNLRVLFPLETTRAHFKRRS